MKMETVGLYTVPCTWITGFTPPAAKPYRRIVGVEYGRGRPERLWSRDGVVAYDRSDARFEELALPQNLAHRLGSFFNRFYVELPRIRHGRDPEDVKAETANCHRFGYWMTGAPVAQDFDLPPSPDHIMRNGKPVNSNLPMGAHGVLGYHDDKTGRGAAVHSFIGLGAKRDDCMEVLSFGGLLGLESYDSVQERYSLNGHRGFHMYA